MSQGRREKFERDCDTALGWISRFRSDTVTEADRQAFALWLAEDPDHGRAMDCMQELWDDLGSLRHLPPHEAPAEPGRRRWVGAAMAAAASLLLALLFLPRGEGPATPEQFRTAVGERRTVELADGSRVTLNTNSRIAVRFGPGARRVTLQRGEAYFDVARDPERPFRVDAGPARITVVGTAFNIYRRDDSHSDITVVEGVVRVTEREAPATRAPASEILRANQRLSTGREGFGTSESADPEPLLAWRRGELVAREMPLATLARELERYSDRRILITDPRVATMTVSGVFQLDRPDTILDALARSHDLRAVPVNGHGVQLLPASQ